MHVRGGHLLVVLSSTTGGQLQATRTSPASGAFILNHLVPWRSCRTNAVSARWSPHCHRYSDYSRRGSTAQWRAAAAVRRAARVVRGAARAGARTRVHPPRLLQSERAFAAQGAPPALVFALSKDAVAGRGNARATAGHIGCWVLARGGLCRRWCGVQAVWGVGPLSAPSSTILMSP